MRITNTIMVNNSLTNLQKSLTALQKYQTQVETGKIIQTASEDPVIASKSIRYRTRLYEIDQYDSNVDEATSWLSSTDTTLSSTYSILKKIRELTQDCSSETITDKDRTQSLIEIKELRSQLAQEANTNVAGRYLLSGFKTDTQVMFTEDTEVTYDLKETLNYQDADEINANEMGTVKGYSLKLLYGTIAKDSIKSINIKTSTGDIVTYPSTTATDEYKINYIEQADSNAYNVPEAEVVGGVTVHTINVVTDTGEIVFNEKDYKELSNNLEIEYTKSRFADGDLNPVHYLKCAEKVTLANPTIGKLSNNRIILEEVAGIKEGSVRGLTVGGTTLIDEDGVAQGGAFINYCKSTDYSPLKANEIRICQDSGEIRLGSNYDAQDGKVVQVSSYYKEETDPELIVSTTEVRYDDKLAGAINNSRQLKLTSKGTIDNNSIQNMVIKKYDPLDASADADGYVMQPAPEIIYTTSDSGVTVDNTKNQVVVYMDTGYMQASTRYDSGCEISMDRMFVTNNNQVNEEIKYEVNSNSSIVVNTLAKDVFTKELIKDLDLLINRIENFRRDEVTEFLQHGLTEIDMHMEEVLKQNSTVGSKMNRLELIKSRLEDDKINFQELQSENEDVDEAEAATNLAIQEMVYNAALQATSKVLQTSLLDFLQ